VGPSARLDVLENRKISCPPGIRTHDRPACSIVAIQIAARKCVIYWLDYCDGKLFFSAFV
jgi:hypothetical protein